MRRQIAVGVDGGLSGWSSVCRPRSEEPHLGQRKFLFVLEHNRKRKIDDKLYKKGNIKTKMKVMQNVYRMFEKNN